MKHKTISLDKNINSKENKLLEFVPNYVEEFPYKRYIDILDEVMYKNLSKIEYAFIIAYYYNNMSQKNIAVYYSVSKQYVSKVIKRSLLKLKCALKKKG